MKFINFLIKPASSLCNLCCDYCFYEDASNNRTVKSTGIMPFAIVDLLLKQTYDLLDSSGTVSFTFQGGEPTLAGLDFFRYFTGQARALCPPHAKIDFSIQTNGILLNEKWAAFFKEQGFLVGLSLDGYKDLHNFHRTDLHKNGSWNIVCRSLKLLQTQNIPVNALCVVTSHAARKPEKIYNEFKKLGIQFMQFIPCLDPLGVERGKQLFSLTPQAYADFLCRLFDLWYNDWVSGQYRSIRLFDDYVNLLLGGNDSACASCGRCGGYFVVESDGGLYPCDFFVLDQWKIGALSENSLAELIQSGRTQTFLRWRENKPAECAGCPWGSLCNGGCKNDWIDTANGPHNYFCSSLQRFFAYAMPRLLNIAQAERQARHGLSHLP